MQICYAKFRAWPGGGVMLAHRQDNWINVHYNCEFPDSPEPTEPDEEPTIPI